jgi:hypothetical protein
MVGGFDHSPGVASGTDTATFARPGDEKIVTALGTSGAGRTLEVLSQHLDTSRSETES